MRHRLYVHVVWTTRGRARLIDARIARFLRRFLAAVAQQERARVLELGLVQTHVHLLIRLHPTTSIPRLLQRLKGGSAVIAVREGHAELEPLKWEKGYSASSVSEGALERVARYVRSQSERHPAEAIPGWPPADGSMRGIPVALRDS